MPRVRRRFLEASAEVGIYHCINRCVRRAFLCGADSVTGKNFDHRRQKIQDRLEYLAGAFGIDVLGFAVMSNHFHVILRNRPDVVQNWNDLEVAQRWLAIFPKRRDDDGNALPPTEFELSTITAIPNRLAEVRKRLSDVSWFMRCLVEPIAREANKEDQVTGSFWEGRYKCQPLLDESALAACLAYVDLNPIRAQIAETPETSKYTSVYERIRAAVTEAGQLTTELADQHAATTSLEPKDESATATAPNPTQPDHEPLETKPERPIGEWLSQFVLSEKAEREPVPNGRASNKGCLPMSFADYLELLDWTGRQLRSDKRGAIPQQMAPILERLKITEDGWLLLMRRFRRMFRRAAGRPQSMVDERQRRGCQLMQVISHSRAVFV